MTDSTKQGNPSNSRRHKRQVAKQKRVQSAAFDASVRKSFKVTDRDVDKAWKEMKSKGEELKKTKLAFESAVNKAVDLVHDAEKAVAEAQKQLGQYKQDLLIANRNLTAFCLKNNTCQQCNSKGPRVKLYNSRSWCNDCLSWQEDWFVEDYDDRFD